jgi:hypothetical protein
MSLVLLLASLAHADSLGTPTLWNGDVAASGLQTTTFSADATGDGKDDVISFQRNEWGTGTARGDVYVGRSTGTALATPARWHSSFCVGTEVCAVGDVNGDGRSDIIAFTHNSAKDVYVALSNGTSFGASVLWHTNFGDASDQLHVADMNNDGRADIIATRPGSSSVWVGYSNGANFTSSGSTWTSSICSASSGSCQVADVNGDGRGDLVAFSKAGAGSVKVAVQTGATLAAVSTWSSAFCAAGDVCFMRDIDRDGQADAVSFGKVTSAGTVRVAYSANTTLRAPATLRTSFCTGSRSCLLGDLNGDGAEDAIELYHRTSSSQIGDVKVSIASAPRTRTCALDFDQMYAADAQEDGLVSDGDEPYLMIFPFRVTVATYGTAEVSWGGALFEIDDHVYDGDLLTIPDSMGRITLPSVERVEADSYFAGQRMWLPHDMPEAVGAVIVAMESDASSWSQVDSLAEDVRDAIEVALQDHVEDLDLTELISAQDPEAWIQSRANAAMADVTDAVVPTGWDAFSYWASSYTDPDDLIDVQVVFHLAGDPGLSSEDRTMGILRELAFTSTSELRFSGDGATYGLRGSWTCH